MKLSKKFSKFKDESALIIVTGKQDAIFYQMVNGEVNKIEAFKIPKPKYSDNEGHQRSSGVATSWTKEVKDENILKDFKKELNNRLKKMNLKFDKLYLFVPSHHKNNIKKALPKSVADKLSGEVLGNFYYRSPEFLLERLLSRV